MNISFLKYILIIYCSIYSFYKILNTSYPYKFYNVISILFSSIVAIIISFIPKKNVSFITLFLLFIIILFILTTSRIQFSISLPASIISFGISYAAIDIANLFLSIFVALIYKEAKNVPIPYFSILGSFLQFLLVYKIFKIKRLRNGMPFLKQKTFPYLGIVISSTIILIFYLLIFTNTQSAMNYFIPLLSISVLAIALLYWWRRKITQSYIEKLRLGELEDLYKDLENKEKEIEKLRRSNEYLDRIIHKDNKLIPAMEFAICSYLQNAAEMEPDHAKRHGEDLLLQLQELSAERKGIINTYKENTSRHPKTDIPALDAVLQYMEKRANESGIHYALKFDNNLKELLPGYVSEADALHLLSDLIENAIIAASHSTKKEILIHLGFSYENLFFDIYDSGVPFTVETYQNFGSQRYTTYADSGGSGIGLTDIWKLKRKYKASLQIYEFAPGNDTFTKKIRILFDRKNHFLIQTYRSKEIRSNIIRSDLHVFPYGEYTLSEIIEAPSSNQI